MWDRRFCWCNNFYEQVLGLKVLTKCTSDDVSSLTSFMNGDFPKTAVPAKMR